VADIEIVRADDEALRDLLLRRQLPESDVRWSLQLARNHGAIVARDAYEPIAYALVLDTEDERCVADVFVEPSYRSRGIASRLLKDAFADAGDASRAMIVENGDPAATALAIQFRLTPADPLAIVTGAMPSEEALLQLAAGGNRFDVEPIDVRNHAGILAELDRETRGAGRAFLGGESGVLFFLKGECVGYAFVAPDGGIGPVASAAAAYLPAIFAYALVTLRRSFGATWCRAVVPARASRLLRAALRTGLRIERLMLMAREAALPELDRYVAAHRLTV
jgi:GNAT superfamily N-acetyltransferase